MWGTSGTRRVLVSHEKRGGKVAHMLLTRKHTVKDKEEQKRITDLGGAVVFGRLFGTLAVARAFGDYEFKREGKEYVSIAPYVCVQQLSRQDDALIVACDGLWDKITYEEAANEVAKHRKNGLTPQQAAEELVKLAYEKGSQDNITAVVVYLYWS